MIGKDGRHSHYLYGHDERHWFVAAIPDRERVSTVRAALEALKPRLASEREARVHLTRRERHESAAREPGASGLAGGVLDEPGDGDVAHRENAGEVAASVDGAPYFARAETAPLASGFQLEAVPVAASSAAMWLRAWPPMLRKAPPA